MAHSQLPTEQYNLSINIISILQQYNLNYRCFQIVSAHFTSTFQFCSKILALSGKQKFAFVQDTVMIFQTIKLFK
jgi:hypothetical protein